MGYILNKEVESITGTKFSTLHTYFRLQHFKLQQNWIPSHFFGQSKIKKKTSAFMFGLKLFYLDRLNYMEVGKQRLNHFRSSILHKMPTNNYKYYNLFEIRFRGVWLFAEKAEILWFLIGLLYSPEEQKPELPNGKTIDNLDRIAIIRL